MWQVFGQARAISLLENSLKKERLAHAYLFVGPPQVGKMTLALNLAQAVNCIEQNPPCQECSPCRRIATSKSADLQVIGRRAESKAEISIDQVREMCSIINLPPLEGNYKVCIIDRAELLSPEAANCLLKTIEEPPPRILFILLTAREHMLLPTIRSRCQRVELPPLSLSQTRGILIEQYKVEQTEAELLAHLCQGCLGGAVSALQEEQILPQRSRDLATLIELSRARRGERLGYAAKLATEFSKNREGVERTLSLWTLWWRDLLLIKTGGSHSIVNLDYENELSHQAEAHSLRHISDFIHKIQTATGQLRENTNPHLALEVLLLRMPCSGENNQGAGHSS